MSENRPGEKPWWRRLDGVPPGYALRPTYTRPPLLGWRLVRRVVFIAAATSLGLLTGLTVDEPGGQVIFSAGVLGFGVFAQVLGADGPWLWSEALDSGDVNAGRELAMVSMAPYLIAYAVPALVVCATRWVAGSLPGS